MKEFWKNLKGWQKNGIICGFLAIILIVVIVAIFIINAEPKVEISFTESNNIPSGELKKVRINLEGVIKNNTENFNKDTIYRGVGRDYKETIDGKITTAKFIVDFDEIAESYAVMVTWPDPDDGSPNIVVSCALLDGKYPKTPCATESNSSSDITSYFPYEGTLPSGEKYKILAKYSGEELYLEVGTKGNAEEAIKSAKELIASLDFNPNDYLFYVSTKQYIQVNHSTTNDKIVNEYLPYFIPGEYNIYPVVDRDNNVTSIHADLAACTDYQSGMAEGFVNDYLNSKGIKYPIEFGYCVD